jgi:hypothetical protein
VSHASKTTLASYGWSNICRVVKVHYTFDKEAQVRCLARWPQVLQIRAAALDEQNIIGLIELKTCLQAVAQGSPEIVDQPDLDYTVYVYDYSEPDTPLVGQGILSWNLEGSNDSQAPAMLTGRVTKNPLAVFSSGVKETLEVRLKLTAIPKMQRASEPAVGQKALPTPTDTSEWRTFMQSNPALGRSTPVMSFPSSPRYPPAQVASPAPFQPNPPPLQTHSSFQGSTQLSAFMSSPRPLVPRRGSLPPPALEPLLSPAMEKTQLVRGEDQALPPLPTTIQPMPPKLPKSRSSSITRRPVGRPRRRALPNSAQNGNTSAAELTDNDEGPQKKRVKTTVAEWPSSGPFGAAPESLRVAASTAGSLRSMRPVGSTQDLSVASHLQEIPRAPTPIPEGPPLKKPKHAKRKAPARPGNHMAVEPEAQSPPTEQQSQGDVMPRPMFGQDARSPADSVAVTSPEQNFTPADSPADVGSSPPVPRSATFMRSSPPARSSPALPPMAAPLKQPDSGFMSGGLDDFMDEDEVPQELPPASHHPPNVMPEAAMEEAPPQTEPSTEGAMLPPTPALEFCEVNPGPPELLPVTSIFKPHGVVKRLNPQIKSERRSMSQPNNEPMAVLPDSGLPSEPPSQALDGLPEFVLPSEPFGERSNSMDLGIQLEALTPQEIEDIEIGNHLDDLIRLDPAVTENAANSARLQPEVIILDDESAQATLKAFTPITGPNGVPVIPASDPVFALPAAIPPNVHSEAQHPPSDVVDYARLNKNYLKRQTIREKLQDAIARGEMPPYCQNCGAVETPTWRKIWTQDHEGVPEYHDYSEKPGCVTAIEILSRDDDGKPTMYKVIKKNLGPEDDKSKWNELLLCNRE